KKKSIDTVSPSEVNTPDARNINICWSGCPENKGLIGGSTLRASRASQSRCLKNGWTLIAFSPPSAATQPNRLAGFLVIKAFTTDTASEETHTGNTKSSRNIASNKSSSVSASKGGCPATISYNNTPRAHQSTLAPYGNS
ncbi:hypothetical protein ALC56_12939, partial [Trachymyrmex septentrionalis]